MSSPRLSKGRSVYRPVVGVIATNLSVAPSFHREVIIVFSMRPASLLRVCVRPAE